jgi:hypothetical protein
MEKSTIFNKLAYFVILKPLQFFTRNFLSKIINDKLWRIIIFIALMTLVLTLVLGIRNYRLTSQTKNLEKLKNHKITILHNTLGFIELEKKIF